MALPAIADVGRRCPLARSTSPRGRRSRRSSSLLPAGSTSCMLTRTRPRVRGPRYPRRCCCRTRFSRRSPAWRAGIAERWGYRTDWRAALLTRAIAAPTGVHQVELLPASRARARVRERTAVSRDIPMSGGAARRLARATARRRLGRRRAARGRCAGRGVRRRQALAAGVVRGARARRCRPMACARCWLGSAADLRGRSRNRSGRRGVARRRLSSI